MTGLLTELTGGRFPYGKGYGIMKYPHPDANQEPSFVKTVGSLEEGRAICSAPESSYKEGDTKNWYFLGYTENTSRSGHITLFRFEE